MVREYLSTYIRGGHVSTNVFISYVVISIAIGLLAAWTSVTVVNHVTGFEG